MLETLTWVFVVLILLSIAINILLVGKPIVRSPAGVLFGTIIAAFELWVLLSWLGVL